MVEAYDPLGTLVADGPQATTRVPRGGARRDPASGRGVLRGVPGERGRRVRVRHPRRRDAGPERGPGPLAAAHLHPGAPRAGRRLHGRRLRAPHRQAGRVPRDPGPGRHQPGHRRRRRQPGQRAARGAHRPGGAGRHAQGDAPVHRHRRDAAAHDQVERARARPAHGRRGRAQGLRRGRRREARGHAPGTARGRHGLARASATPWRARPWPTSSRTRARCSAPRGCCRRPRGRCCWWATAWCARARRCRCATSAARPACTSSPRSWARASSTPPTSTSCSPPGCAPRTTRAGSWGAPTSWCAWATTWWSGRPRRGTRTGGRRSSASTRCRPRSTPTTCPRWSSSATSATSSRSSAACCGTSPWPAIEVPPYRRALSVALDVGADDDLPVKPQRVLHDLRQAMAPHDVLDLGCRRPQAVDRALLAGARSPTPCSSATASRPWASPCPRPSPPRWPRAAAARSWPSPATAAFS